MHKAWSERNLMTISEKIQHYRKSAGLSQEELAKHLLVSRQTISLWENGQTLPTIDNLIRLRDIFNVSLDEMLCEDDAGVLSAHETFDENYTTAMHPSDIKGIKRALLIPSVLSLTALLILACSTLIYSLRMSHDGLAIRILLYSFSTLTLAVLILGVIFVIHQLRAIAGQTNRPKNIMINDSILCVEEKHGNMTLSVSKADHKNVTLSYVSPDIINVKSTHTSLYIRKDSLSDTSRLWSMKRRTSPFKYIAISLALVTLLCVFLYATDLSRSTPLAKIERYSGVDIPNYSGINESDKTGKIGGVYVEYAAELFIDPSEAHKITDSIQSNSVWQTMRNDTSLDIPEEIFTYKGAEYFVHREYKEGRHVIVVYYLDESMLRVVLLTK